MRVRRRYLAILVFLLVVPAGLIVMSNSLAQSTLQHVGTVTPPPSPQCRSGIAWAGANNPLRYRVVSNCVVASGIVESVSLQDSLDRRIYVHLDAQYAKLLDDGNPTPQEASLILQLIPEDQAAVPVPTVGQHITFVGPLVYDTENHWNTIYPVWSIQGD